MDNSFETGRVSERLLEALHLQKLENNPLTDDEVEMFEMFERMGWSHERRRAYIRAQFEAAASAAE